MNTQRTHRMLLLIAGIFIALATLTLTSCDDKVKVTQTYTVMEPLYLSPEALRESFEVSAPVEVTNTGKIYLYQNYILLNEPGKGIHIIDNSDKSNPEIISFVNIPGNYEMAVRGDRLFADSYIDLLVLNISDPKNISLGTRIEDIFLDLAQQDQYYDIENGVIIDWEPTEVIEVTEGEFEGSFPSYYSYKSGFAFRGEYAMMNDAMWSSFAPESAAPVMQTGVGGSMARFTIMKEHLYSIDNSHMQIFDISNLDNPEPGAKLNIGWGIETIFPYKDNLFIGSQDGMHIYDNTNPEFPMHLSTYSHIVSCDPVVVEDDIAYVTLRSGTGCRNSINSLDVIDISDLTNPSRLESYPMTNPHGLGIDQGTLFICDGNAGLKVYDASDIYKIDENMLVNYSQIDAFDVIPYNGTLIMIGNDGLYQFDYANPSDIKYLSVININRENQTL